MVGKGTIPSKNRKERELKLHWVLFTLKIGKHQSGATKREGELGETYEKWIH